MRLCTQETFPKIRLKARTRAGWLPQLGPRGTPGDEAGVLLVALEIFFFFPVANYFQSAGFNKHAFFLCLKHRSDFAFQFMIQISFLT